MAVGLVLCLLVGCGGASGELAREGAARSAPEPPAATGERSCDRADRRGAFDVEREGELAGTLVLEPRSPEPGQDVGVAVRNVGEVGMFYGLGNGLERCVRGRWLDVTGELGPIGAVPRIGLEVPPGKQAGPEYVGGELNDGIGLPFHLEPGTYRVVKDAGLTLDAGFVVPPPSSDSDR